MCSFWDNQAYNFIECLEILYSKSLHMAHGLGFYVYIIQCTACTQSNTSSHICACVCVWQKGPFTQCLLKDDLKTGLYCSGFILVCYAQTVDVDNPWIMLLVQVWICSCMDNPWIACSICTFHKMKGTEHEFGQSGNTYVRHTAGCLSEQEFQAWPHLITYHCKSDCSFSDRKVERWKLACADHTPSSWLEI